jgi:hypothetical protein
VEFAKGIARAEATGKDGIAHGAGHRELER